MHTQALWLPGQIHTVQPNEGTLLCSREHSQLGHAAHEREIHIVMWRRPSTQYRDSQRKFTVYRHSRAFFLYVRRPIIILKAISGA